MRYLIIAGLVGLTLATVSAQQTDAPTGFDNQSNGMVDDATFQADRQAFNHTEDVADGLGPLYNAQSCRECHQNPISGGASQVTILHVGHLEPDGRFGIPRIPLANRSEIIHGRTLVNDRAICPNADFPNMEIQEEVPATETIRSHRLAVNLLGDGFVEAVADQTLVELARKQCVESHGEICGQVLYVPILEAPPETGVGRFGWKNQHSSLLSFCGDASQNEMGITNRLFPYEVTQLCNTVPEPNSKSGPDGLEDIDRFARFIRATKAPARETVLAGTPQAMRGSELFDQIGCAACHIRTLITAPAGTRINGGTFTIPHALGQKTFHPFSDFLLHNVGTGDGIVMPWKQYNLGLYHDGSRTLSDDAFQETRNKIRTAPLWGVRLRLRMMHDGASVTLREAILRHGGEARNIRLAFHKLPRGDQEALLEFLRSL